MPESVRDRPAKGHEYLFLLSKSERYFYDSDAIREPAVEYAAFKSNNKLHANMNRNDRTRPKGLHPTGLKGRNRRIVWFGGTKPFKGAHFATCPPKLIEPCILAGTSEAGCCPECGTPWVRVVE